MATGTKRAKLPRPHGHQITGIDAIVKGLRRRGRGQVRAACGTGKTLMSIRAASRLCRRGLVVVSCPSIPLIAQTLKAWESAGIPMQVLAVCSDESVVDSPVRVKDLECPVTTDQQTIVDWIKHASTTKLRLILVTHVSSSIVAEGIRTASVEADLLVVDEAHGTAGRTDKRVTVVHNDSLMWASRRLYMTATPRVLKKGAKGADDMLSMDDESVFGPVLHRYSFAQGVADDWLDDYRVLVVGVTSKEALEFLRQAGDTTIYDESGVPLRIAAFQTALAKAAAEFALRRIMVLTPRITMSKEFARTLPTRVAALPEHQRPKGKLTAVHVDGNQSAKVRKGHLNALAHPPEGGWTVVSNVRCLITGIDVPKADGLAFTWKKTSLEDIVQAVGRVTRRDREGSGVATILVPVLLPDDPDEPFSLGAWAPVIQILRALRAEDEDMATSLDKGRIATSSGGKAELPPRVLLRMPEGYRAEETLQHITVRILEETTSDWLVSFAELKKFKEAKGHLRVPVGYVSNGVRLQSWGDQQRASYKVGRLNRDRVQLLESIGFEWAPKAAAWNTGLAAAKSFFAEHGHLDVPPGTVINGVDLYDWLRHQGTAYRTGDLLPDRVIALEALGMNFQRSRATYEEGLAAVKKFYKEHRHLQVPVNHMVDGINVYVWLGARRDDNKKRRLGAVQKRQLTAMGMVWSLREAAWLRNLAIAAGFFKREGHLRPPKGHREGGIDLSKWVNAQRAAKAKGKLSKAKTKALEAIGMEWEVSQGWWAYHETRARSPKAEDVQWR